MTISRPPFAAAIALLTAVPAQAVDWDYQGLVGADATFGGDELFHVDYDNGTTSTVSAGRGLALKAGAWFSPRLEGPHALDLQACLGFKFTLIAPATNQSGGFTRWPIEVAAYYRSVPYSFRVGGGAQYHVSPKVSASGSVLNGDFTFNNSFGGFVAADYLFNLSERFIFGARYDFLAYRSSGALGDKGGNSFGIYGTYLFGGRHPVSAQAATPAEGPKTSPKDADPPGLR